MLTLPDRDYTADDIREHRRDACRWEQWLGDRCAIQHFASLVKTLPPPWLHDRPDTCEAIRAVLATAADAIVAIAAAIIVEPLLPDVDDTLDD